jgi:hypothetical protein
MAGKWSTRSTYLSGLIDAKIRRKEGYKMPVVMWGRSSMTFQLQGHKNKQKSRGTRKGKCDDKFSTIEINIKIIPIKDAEFQTGILERRIQRTSDGFAFFALYIKVKQKGYII